MLTSALVTMMLATAVESPPVDPSVALSCCPRCPPSTECAKWVCLVGDCACDERYVVAGTPCTGGVCNGEGSCIGLASGVVSGHLQFYQNQGNFCPTTRNCTGARYLQSEFNTYVPLRDIKVYMVRVSDGAAMGQAATDANGNFLLSWSITGSSPVVAQLIVRGEHKDNRFFLRAADGTQLLLNTPTFNATSGSTSSNPQQIGTFAWGGPNNPNDVTNVYDGAWRTWDVLRQSSILMQRFTNLEVRISSPDCPTSCAQSTLNRILLDPGAAYAPQARIMHEMGHIASYRGSGTFRSSGAYCYPNAPGNCGWTIDQPQWSSVSFEEGLATFLGDTGLYSSNAVAPHTCYASQTFCGTGVFNIETSPITCVTDEGRWPLSVDRYLWDAFDSNADYVNEVQTRSWYEFIDALASFPPGEGNRHSDEPWLGNILIDPDGRSAVDFRENWKTLSVDTDLEWSSNCSSPGD